MKAGTRLPVALLALLSLSILGCFDIRYLAQAAHGQRDIVLHQRPISEVIADPSVEPHTRTLLGHVQPIKAFGETNGLLATKSYTHYVDVQRPAAVWVVTACAPLSFYPKQWKFPIAGSVPYLGWFRYKDARAHAEELQDLGWDVDLRRSAAYSTLGWFRDPIVSSMLASGNGALADLADTVLHESFHATLYIAGQTPFNESVASFVGDRLSERYLVSAYGEAAPIVRDHRRSREDGERRAIILHAAYEELDALYRSSAPKEDKMARKTARLAALTSELRYRRPITNATLVGFKNYHSETAVLASLLTACGDDMRRFVQTLRSVTTRTFAGPHDEGFGRIVQSLSDAGCPQQPGDAG